MTAIEIEQSPIRIEDHGNHWPGFEQKFSDDQ